jgi:hypothetical protein
MGEPDKPPWLFYFDNKAMEGIPGLFSLTKKAEMNRLSAKPQNPKR